MANPQLANPPEEFETASEGNIVQSLVSDDVPPESNEPECRVCRGNEEVGRPLYSPCRCLGSIAYVHQDCLERWLEHSHKSNCELCKASYRFESQYADNTPDNIPISLVIKSAFKRIFFGVFSFVLRVVTAAFLWLLVVPLLTSWLYRIWMRNHETSILGKRNHETSILGNPRAFWIENMQLDVVSGIILTGVIAVSFVLLVTVTDIFIFIYYNILILFSHIQSKHKS